MSARQNQAQKVFDLYLSKGLRIATAESCTGGMVAASLTDMSGSSAVFERGFVTYSNEAKMEALGVKPKTLEAFGAVSPQVAEEMARGTIAHSHADIAVSVTGIAGPTGATENKPVGLVWFGISSKKDKSLKTIKHIFSGDRAEVRESATIFALNLLIEAADDQALTP